MQSSVGDDADRTPGVVDHHDRAVGALGDQVQRVQHGLARGQRERGLEHRVAVLHPADHLGQHGQRDVLRDHDQAAATGHGLGHPASGDRGHVGHHDRDRGAGAVAAGQVDVQPRGHVRTVRDEEDVVVGEVAARVWPGRKRTPPR